MTDPLELAIARTLDAPIAAVWRAWTERLVDWWCPRPWRTELHGLELHAGGRFATTMHGPDGEAFSGESVFLEVVPQRRVVFTNALTAGWHPQDAGPVAMVGRFELEPQGDRTLYRASARHWTAEARDAHAAMRFDTGWGAVAAQLEEVARRLA